MKKSRLMFSLAFSGIVCSNMLLAQSTTKEQSTENDTGRPKQDHPYVLVEGKVGYFSPVSSRFRHIYSGSGIYGYEVSCEAYKGLYAWTSGSYANLTGKSEGLNEKTRMHLFPFAFGLKFMKKVNAFDLYAGVGGIATYALINDHSSLVRRRISTWGGGAILKGGMLANLSSRFFFDIYADYSFIWLPYKNGHHHTVSPHSTDISAASIGGGFGYRF